MTAYKYYKRESPVGRGRQWGYYPTLFIRECELRGSLWFTIKWWAQQDDGSWKRRRGKKYISGVKLVKDLSCEEAQEMIFVDSL